MADPHDPLDARLDFRPLRLREGLAASRWRYPAEYAMYDLDLATTLALSLLRVPLFWLAGVSAFAVATASDPLIGVFTLIRRGRDVEIGIGLRPDLMGHKLGLALMLQGMELARAIYHPETFSLSVATFNTRAITVYERAGFQPGPTTPFRFHGKRYESMRMSRPAA